MANSDSARDARRLRRRAERLIANIEQTAGQLAEAVRSAKRDIARIEADERLAPQPKAEDRRAVEERLRKAADKAEERVRDATSQVEEFLGAATSPDDSDPTAALVRESRIARAWQRVERLLNAGEDPTVIAQRAVLDGNTEVVAALSQELPFYLQARGRGAEVRGAMLEIDQAARPVDGPIDEAVREVRGGLERARRDAQLAIDWVRTDGVETTEVPGSGGLIRVDAEPDATAALAEHDDT